MMLKRRAYASTKPNRLELTLFHKAKSMKTNHKWLFVFTYIKTRINFDCLENQNEKLKLCILFVQMQRCHHKLSYQIAIFSYLWFFLFCWLARDKNGWQSDCKFVNRISMRSNNAWKIVKKKWATKSGRKSKRYLVHCAVVFVVIINMFFFVVLVQ